MAETCTRSISRVASLPPRATGHSLRVLAVGFYIVQHYWEACIAVHLALRNDGLRYH